MSIKKYPYVFRTLTAQDYIDEALAAASYINTRKIDTGHGLRWDLKDATRYLERYYDDICLYAGTAGIAHFFLQLYRAVKRKEFLDDAAGAGEYLIWRWRNQRQLAKCFNPYAMTTGWGGVALVLTELWEITKEPLYKDVVLEIGEAAITAALPGDGGVGYYWTSYPGIVGDAGVVLILLKLGEVFGKDSWISFALETGRYYLTRGKAGGENGAGTGLYFQGVDPTYFGAGDDYIDPNFPMGNCGIGYLFLKLYEKSKDPAYLKAAEEIHAFTAALALQDEEKTAALLPHGLPKRPDVYYLNYCHGPVGTARFYHEFFTVTKNPLYRDWEEKLSNGLLKTGAPEYHTPGYWHIHCYCCGTAGMVNMYLGMWAESGDERYLQIAGRCARSLMGWATHKENPAGKVFASWNQAFAFVKPDEITANIGFYDGAAGIGWVLLQMGLALQGRERFFAARSVDDPYPAE